MSPVSISMGCYRIKRHMRSCGRKQLGLTHQNPIGARAGQGWGVSWWVGTLPYMEQATIFNKLTFDGAHPGWVDNGVAAGNLNGMVVGGVNIPYMTCPSSALDPMGNTGRGYRTVRPQYVGITGSTDDDQTPPRWVNTPAQRGCCNCCGGTGAGTPVDG